MNLGRDHPDRRIEFDDITLLDVTGKHQRETGNEVAQRVLRGQPGHHRQHTGTSQQRRADRAQLRNHVGVKHQCNEIDQHLHEQTDETQHGDIRQALFQPPGEASHQVGENRSDQQREGPVEQRAGELIRVEHVVRQQVTELIHAPPLHAASVTETTRMITQPITHKGHELACMRCSRPLRVAQKLPEPCLVADG